MSNPREDTSESLLKNAAFDLSRVTARYKIRVLVDQLV